MSDFIISQIRTWVPIIVGAILAKLAVWGFQIDAVTAAELANWLTAALAGLYYWIARELEKRWPNLGWLLGVAKQPGYDERR